MGWSIRKKLIIFLMMATVLPFGASILTTYYHTKESVKNRFISTNYDIVRSGREDIANYLQYLSKMTTTIYGYTQFMNVLEEGVSSNLRENPEEVNRILMYLFNTRPEIEQIHLYIDKGKDSYTIYNSRLSGRGTYENIHQHPYYSYLSESRYYTTIEPPHTIYSYNNLSQIPQSEMGNVLSFHSIIRDIPSDEFLGFLSIDINMSVINAIVGRLYNEGTEGFYLMDGDGTVIYSSEKKLIGLKNTENWFLKLKESGAASHSLEWKDSNFHGVIVSEKFSAPFEEWYIVKRIPDEILYKGIRETAFMNILIGVTTLIIVVLATLFISFKLTSPIKVLIENMKKVENGELSVEFDSLGNDEFGVLGRHFKSMISTINNLIQREYKLEIENKSTQLKVLQSQINPHFLYNALQSIGTLALKHKAVQVYSLLTSLSKIMRYSMNMNEDTVPFWQEVQHVKSYMTLQKQRFDDRFDYELKVEDEVKDIVIPKMILQPLVENSFKHGFEQKIEKGFIEIRVSLTERGTVLVTVKDNGKGASPVKVKVIEEELKNIKQSTSKKGEAIGLKNIYDRLRIYYHDQAEMLVESGEDEGFKVTIEIPVAMGKELQSL